MLGVLSAVGAGAAPARRRHRGRRDVFFLLVLAGRVFGPGFGFALGCTSLFASALLTGGVGPVDAVPDVRLRLGRARRRPAAAGCAAGRSSRCSPAYGALAGYVFGFLLNLSFWPFALDPGSLDRLPARARRSASSGTATCSSTPPPHWAGTPAAP